MLIRKNVPAILFLLFLNFNPVEFFSQKADLNSRIDLPYSLCRELKTENRTIAQYASDNVSKLFILRDFGSVEAIDIRIGEKLWSSDIGTGETSQIQFSDNNLLILSPSRLNENEIVVNKLSSETGIVISKEIRIKQKTVELFLPDNLSGKNNFAQFPADKTLDLSNFAKLISDFNSQGFSIKLIRERKVFISDEKGTFRLYDSDRRKIRWSVKAGGKITSVSVIGENILLTSLDNFVYCFSIKNGATIWKKRLPGRIIEPPLIDGDSLLFTVLGDKTAYLLNTKNGGQIGLINSDSDAVFTKPLIRIKDQFVMQTSDGISMFSRECTQ